MDNTSDPQHAYLSAEVERLGPLDFVAIAPAGRPLETIQIGKGEDGELAVAVPGRSPIAPELPVPMRAALVDRGFASDDPDNPMRPWLHPVDDAAAGLALATAVLTDVFGAPPDLPVDIVHGSRRAEVEAEKKLQAVRERVEKILTESLGAAPEQDSDGDFQLPLGDVRVTVAPRALPGGGPVVLRIFAVTNINFMTSPELGLFLARLNFGLMFGRFALDVEHNAIWFDETLLGEHFRDEELRFAVQVVSTTADEWDDRIKQMFGGSTYQEVLTSKANGAAPPVKPGEGPGLYL